MNFARLWSRGKAEQALYWFGIYCEEQRPKSSAANASAKRRMSPRVDNPVFAKPLGDRVTRGHSLDHSFGRWGGHWGHSLDHSGFVTWGRMLFGDAWRRSKCGKWGTLLIDYLLALRLRVSPWPDYVCPQGLPRAFTRLLAKRNTTDL